MSDAPTTLAEHDLREAFEAFLAQLRGPALTDFATASKALGTGFRKNPEERVVRAALSTHYGARLKTYHRALAECLGRCSAPAALLRALTPEAIEANGPALMARLGRGEVALAALQDDREPVRKAAEAWLAEPAPLPSPEEAEAVLKEKLGLCLGTAGDSPAGQRGEIARLRQELKDERAAHKQSRAEAKAAQDKAALQAKADRATADFNLAELSRKVTELEAKLRKAEEEREGLVANELARRLPQAFHGWLAPCLKAEAAVQADTAAPLLERAEQALADQARHDRAAALHATLLERLGAVQTMLRRVDDALAFSQARLPALVDIREQLVAERESLRQSLRAEGAEPPISLVAAQLRTAIHASRERQQPDLEHLLRLALRFHLIDRPERDALLRDLARRQALWGIEVPDKDAPPEAAPADASTTIARRNPALAAALRGTARAYLFFDGHNILNGIGRYRVPRGVPGNHECARKHLEDDLAILLADLPLVVGMLVWDGEISGDYTKTDNLSIRFSGGTGEHRADNFILHQLDYFRNDGVPMVVVTNDNDFRGKAAKIGAVACSIPDFDAFLAYAINR